MSVSSVDLSLLLGRHLANMRTTEYPNLRVFNVHPGMAKSSVLRPELEIYAKDTRECIALHWTITMLIN